MSKDVEKIRRANSEWYERNRDHHNGRRRKRYASDPTYRKEQIKRARRYREERRSGSRTRSIFLNGSMVTVYSAGFVAEKIGRTSQVVRLWEKKEIIPAPTVEGVQRYYTAHQVQLIAWLASVVGASKEGFSDRSVKSAIQQVREQWEQ